MALITAYIALTCLLFPVSYQDKIPLYLSYITSLTGQGFTAIGEVPALQLALEQINTNTDILHNYILNVSDILDSKCERTTALDSFFDLHKWDSNRTYIATYCCGCSIATVPVAEISHYWNIPHVSIDPAFELNERNRFKSFFRTIPTTALFQFGVTEMIEMFGWRKLIAITQAEDVFFGFIFAMEGILSQRGIIFDTSITITSDIAVFPYSQVFDKIEQEFFKVILINTYSQFAYQILCEAYHRGYHTKNVVWIIQSFYNTDWWKNVEMKNETCSSEMIEMVLQGSIGIAPEVELNNGTAVTSSGLTPDEFSASYSEISINTTYNNISLQRSIYASIVFDLIWSLALGLNKTAQLVADNNISDTNCSDELPGELVPLEEFDYSNQLMGCVLQDSIQKVKFLGLSGDIAYNDNGSQAIDRPLHILQYQRNVKKNLEFVTVGIVNAISPYNISITFVNSTAGIYSIWEDGVPYDGYPQDVFHSNDLALIIVYSFLSFMGLLFSITCLIFNIMFKNHRLVKLTSPKLNVLIIFGTISLYCAVFFYSFSPSDELGATVFCNLGNYLFTFGYTMCFAILLSKTWRIYYIFTNPTQKKTSIKDWMLVIIALVIVSIDMLIVTIGTSIPETKLVATTTADTLHDDTNIEYTRDAILYQHYTYVCTVGNSLVWVGLSFGYKGLLQIVAMFMAFHTRRIKIAALNDSKEIAVIIYINSIILIVMAGSEFALEHYHDVHSALFGLALLIQATMFLGVLFIPNMIRVYKDPKGDDAIQTTNGNSIPAVQTIPKVIGGGQNESTVTVAEEIDMLKKRIRELETGSSML